MVISATKTSNLSPKKVIKPFPTILPRVPGVEPDTLPSTGTKSSTICAWSLFSMVLVAPLSARMDVSLSPAVKEHRSFIILTSKLLRLDSGCPLISVSGKFADVANALRRARAGCCDSVRLLCGEFCRFWLEFGREWSKLSVFLLKFAEFVLRSRDRDRSRKGEV